jgi:hypothetical protein
MRCWAWGLFLTWLVHDTEEVLTASWWSRTIRPTDGALSARALGQHAVEHGLRVAWFQLEDLGALIRAHRPDDTVTRTVARIFAPT